MEPQQAKVLTYQLWTAHNLERIGDRATNICERVIYLVTGRLEEANVSRYEGASHMPCGLPGEKMERIQSGR